MTATRASRIFPGIGPAVFLCSLAAVGCSSVGPPAPIGPLPTARQMRWHEMEMNAFVHFSINTFTDRE